MKDGESFRPLKTRRAVVATLAVIAAMAAVGVVLAVLFVQAERERALQDWQVRLGIVADSRLAEVQRWLDGQFGALSGLAENASLQLYVTELTLTRQSGTAADTDSIQTEILRTLLVATAQRTGFSGEPVGPSLPANVRRVGVAGIAILDREGRRLAASADMPPVQGPLLAFVLGAEAASRAHSDMAPGPSGAPSMAFLVPIFAVQGEAVPADQVGWILGVKEVAGELFPLLRQPGAVEKSAETLLVRPQGATVEYLSPLADGRAPLSLRLALDTPGLAAAYLISRPGGFGVLRDYRGTEVLATGRILPETGWTLVRKVDRSEALGASDARLTRILVLLLLVIALAVAAVLGLWWHGASLRAGAAADRLRETAMRLAEREAFLRLVTDSQASLILVVDRDQRVRFANAAAAGRAGVSAEEMTGKTPSALFGPQAAKFYEAGNREALETALPAVRQMREEGDGPVRIAQSRHIPMDLRDGRPQSVLLVEQDITAAVIERERRERIQRDLVSVLVGLVDRRDPNAADHSVKVSLLARRVAEEMGLSRAEAEAAEAAGRLMNLGKILVPEAILTKAEPLTAEELGQVREGLRASADLVSGVDFEGPVEETLRQWQARWDGAGHPPGLAGEDILPTARIVAVANAYVAMTSARAHRAGLNQDRAIEAIWTEVGKAYDRRVTAALVNYLDNRSGREELAGLRR